MLSFFSQSFSDHLQHVKHVLTRFQSSELTVKATKCRWCYYSFEFLGFMVREGRLSIPQSRIHSLASYSLPKTITQLRSFLGLVNYYSRFVPSLCSYTSMLTPHITKTSPQHVLWNADMTVI